jgi:acetyltransferase-like isoleucine patch superfamily enzyme
MAVMRSTLVRLVGRIAEAPVWLRSRLMAVYWLRQCDTVGPKTRTFFKPHIHNRGRIDIGRGVRLNSNWAPLELVTGPQGRIEIEDGVYINYGTLVSAQERVRIGANVMVGNYSIIADTDIPGIAEPPGAPVMKARPVEIGEGAWLAARVTVLPGARIGAGAVIAAGSVVAGEIPAGAVAGGIPARVLKSAGAEAAKKQAGTAGDVR